ncbi:MAG: 4-(cytidine 5'-diphospho)-2-C-methyl-D-erythritol kinase [Desulfobacterales bacterium]|jgi:4-diphosphocytidyl-2-C-methyl-D-erythritol kinase|nr:4-(cytidine 5'-diphospho)-2-C-methyl-D-erythritol kinase [Desulfobacteraceae bacterium]MDD3991449.1 4-(cytidine 5'-diphospho)-2-C-methyl-D-erythritol kinase [Desulfobacteraceae bacterium]MDY0311659.1 4-(cytidine 5'-diphospho)-2-C-methyl-D-erythritol kinase [Desulfobacterales bacterium]
MCAKNTDGLRLRLQAPAKLNLFLAVTGRRADGYHDIVSLMVCVGLHDSLEVDLEAHGLTVSSNLPEVPDDDRNLALRAARAFFEATGRPANAAIRIRKRIPVGAGLGGGSSDAASILTGLNRHFGYPLPRHALVDLGLKLGADVPFFIQGRPALATGIGERLAPFDHLAPASALIVFPAAHVSTAEVYGRLNLTLTTCGKKPKVFALKSRVFDTTRHLCNDLEAVAGKLHPVILEAKATMLALGADGASMTGSGSAVFGLFRDPEAAVYARDHFPKRRGWRFFLTYLVL